MDQLKLDYLEGLYVDGKLNGILYVEVDDSLSVIKDIAFDLGEVLNVVDEYVEGDVGVEESLRHVKSLRDTIDNYSYGYVFEHSDIVFSEVIGLVWGIEDHLKELENFVKHVEHESDEVDELFGLVLEYRELFDEGYFSYSMNDERLEIVSRVVSDLRDVVSKGIRLNVDGEELLKDLLYEVSEHRHEIQDYISFVNRFVYLNAELSDRNVDLFFLAEKCGFDINEIRD